MYEMNRPKIGDKIQKRTGDYKFDGEIICEFTKKDGAIRYVVEDDRGLCLIMNEKQITG